MKGFYISQSAEGTPYDNQTSGLSAEEVQSAIDELSSSSTLFTNVTTFIRMLTLEMDSIFKLEMDSLACITTGSNERTVLVGQAILEQDSIIKVQANAVMTVEGV